MSLFFEGFLLQASLIIALGAQNVFVLDSGLKKRRHFFVAFICSLCDAILIFLGVLGAASIFIRIPSLKLAFGVLGVLFLVFYGVKKLREAFLYHSEQNSLETKANEDSIYIVVLTALSFSLLNPHVYLDTVILIGGYSAKFELLEQRFWFGSGAAVFSTLWFYSLAFFSAQMSQMLSSEKMQKRIAFASGSLLLWMSFKLGSDVYGWFFV